MQARELRIGNIVKAMCYDDKTFHEQTIVSQIDEDEIGHDAVGMVWSNNSNEIEGIKPIPLTEQWLLDFGFENGVLELNSSYKLRLTQETHYERSVYLENIRTSILMIISVKHVHQLQNLYFALTQKELIIK